LQVNPKKPTLGGPTLQVNCGGQAPGGAKRPGGDQKGPDFSLASKTLLCKIYTFPVPFHNIVLKLAENTKGMIPPIVWC
jgi:hypothetical protein